jgi:F0F1-type ATP synthase assembly protein I
MMTGEYDGEFLRFGEWWTFGFFLVFVLVALAIYNLINALVIVYIKVSWLFIILPFCINQ